MLVIVISGFSCPLTDSMLAWWLSITNISCFNDTKLKWKFGTVSLYHNMVASKFHKKLMLKDGSISIIVSVNARIAFMCPFA